MNLDAFDTFALNSLTLGVFWWSLASRGNKIENLKQLLRFAYARQIRERVILVQAKTHLRTYAKAVSMVEMSSDKRIVVTITMNTFARDNLYSLIEQLEDYTPDTLLEQPKERA